MNRREILRHDTRLREITARFRSSGVKKRARDFYCPILQIEGPAELCKGHIISKSVGGRTWVVQRKDVDNFFGSFAEAGFGHGVKLRSMESQEAVEYVIGHRLAAKADLSIVDGTGAKGSVRPTKAQDGGWEIVVRPDGHEIDLGGELSLSMELDVRYETLLTCLHSAHLGLFESAGYGYATSSSGRFVASLLRDVYLRFSDSKTRKRRDASTRREEIGKLCRAHRNMVRPVISVEGLDRRLLDNPFRWFIVCWCEGSVFATIHYLPAGTEWNAVMIYGHFDRRAVALISAAMPMSFKVTVGRLVHGVIHVAPVRDDSPTMIWTCGDGNRGEMAPLSVEAAVGDLRIGG